MMKISYLKNIVDFGEMSYFFNGQRVTCCSLGVLVDVFTHKYPLYRTHIGISHVGIGVPMKFWCESKRQPVTGNGSRIGPSQHRCFFFSVRGFLMNPLPRCFPPPALFHLPVSAYFVEICFKHKLEYCLTKLAIPKVNISIYISVNTYIYIK